MLVTPVLTTSLTRAFLDGGHPTTVWNRSAARADGLVAHGAARAVTVAEAVAASPVAVVCVLDHTAVREVIDAAGGALSGRVLVDLTSGTPQDARETARWAAQLGADPGLAVLHDLALLGVMWSGPHRLLPRRRPRGHGEGRGISFAPMAARWLGGIAAMLTGRNAQHLDVARRELGPRPTCCEPTPCASLPAGAEEFDETVADRGDAGCRLAIEERLLTAS
ncbi:MAG: NAD(P)-binding domain-containing protein [Pseudonocardiaceae bacterium]